MKVFSLRSSKLQNFQDWHHQNVASIAPQYYIAFDHVEEKTSCNNYIAAALDDSWDFHKVDDLMASENLEGYGLMLPAAEGDVRVYVGQMKFPAETVD